MRYTVNCRGAICFRCRFLAIKSVCLRLVTAPGSAVSLGVRHFILVGIAARCLLSWMRGEIRFEAAPLVAPFLPLSRSGFTSVVVVVEESLFDGFDVESSRQCRTKRWRTTASR